jgi:hypothetical protein
MIEDPFDVIRCSWPQIVEYKDRDQVFEPNWEAPLMIGLPQIRWEPFDADYYWTIDWRDWFRSDLRCSCESGQMRGFYIVFHVRINDTGTIRFYGNSQCIIRRNGTIVYEQRNSQLEYGELDVRIGDCLEIAQSHQSGEWKWGGRLVLLDRPMEVAKEVLFPYLAEIQRRLETPNGPPLKMFCSGKNPICTVVSLYSMILNGYSPAGVFLFGEYQWPKQSLSIFVELLSFAKIIPTETVLDYIQPFSSPQLVDRVQRDWTTMKVCISLLTPPTEFCYMDDDIFILDRVDDALNVFIHHNLVFSPDKNYSDMYLRAWPKIKAPVRTGAINTGLYWLRNTLDPESLAADMLCEPHTKLTRWQWDQGFVATCYANDSIFQLSSQRYFYPLFDGLPNGILGYDYANNPCDFTAIHFGGLSNKPTDKMALRLAPQILNRSVLKNRVYHD